MWAAKLYLARVLGRSFRGSALRWGEHGILLEQGRSEGSERQVVALWRLSLGCASAAAALADPHLLLSTALALASGNISPPSLAVGVGPDRARGRCHSCPTHTSLLSCASAPTAAFYLADSR